MSPPNTDGARQIPTACLNITAARTEAADRLSQTAYLSIDPCTAELDARFIAYTGHVRRSPAPLGLYLYVIVCRLGAELGP